MNRRRERTGYSGGIGLRSSSERPVSHRAELHKESAPRVKSQLDVETWQLHNSIRVAFQTKWGPRSVATPRDNPLDTTRKEREI